MGRGSGDSSCSKILLIVLNSIFLILGLGVLALGIYLKLDPNYSTVSKLFNIDLVNEANKTNSYLINLEAASIVVIIIGAVIVGITIMGMLGACFEIKCLVILYGVVITLMLLALIAIGIAAIVYKYALHKNLENEFKNIFKKQIDTMYQGQVDNKNAFTIAADMFQIYFQCCGVNNYTDFNTASSWYKTIPYGPYVNQNMVSPIACCKFTDEQRNAVLKGQFPNVNDYTCTKAPTPQNSNAFTGCLTPLNSYLDSILLAVLIVTLIVGFILIIGSVGSCCLCRGM